MAHSRAEGRDSIQKTDPAPRRGRVLRSGGAASLGAHVRALDEALGAIIDGLSELPSDRRVRLRTVRAALRRAYPRELELSETELAWLMEDPDGEAF